MFIQFEDPEMKVHLAFDVFERLLQTAALAASFVPCG